LKLNGECVKICVSAEIGNGVCNPECNDADHQFDGADCVVCKATESKVNGKCVPVCVEVKAVL
jgi:hypothetical protein